MPRSVPLSVRITDADAAFLARYKVEGATTPSEKLRALLAEARAQHDEAARFSDKIDRFSAQLAPGLREVRELQRENRIRSDLVLHLYERMPELAALLATGPVEHADPQQSLVEFEDDLARLIFSLIEEVLDLGLTDNQRTYRTRLVQNNLEPVLEVIEMLRRKNLNEGETQ